MDFHLDEPMDKQFPYNNLVISPNIEGNYEWLDGNNNVVDQFSDTSSSVLRFTPINNYTYQEYYTITLKNSFTD